MSVMVNPYRFAAAGGYTPPSLNPGAHRYWAISGKPGFTFGGGNYFWNVGEADFLDANLASLVVGGAAISSGFFSGFPASNAFDGSTSSVVSLNANAAQAGTGLCYIGYDFGIAVTPCAVKLWSSTAAAAWQILYSDDGVTWTAVKAAKTSAGTLFYQVDYGFNEPADTSLAAASYARLVILEIAGQTSSSARASAAEIEFLSGGVDQASGGSAFASTANASFPAANAFDNSASTLWVCNSRDSLQYIGYSFAGATNVDGFSYTYRGTSPVADESPGGYVLQLGSSISGPWTSVKWRTRLAALALGQKVAF